MQPEAEQQPEAPAIPGASRWRIRLAEVSAIQWTGGNDEEVDAFAGGMTTLRAPMPPAVPRCAMVWTAPGRWWQMEPGWWVIRADDGSLGGLPAEDFAAAYEPAGEPLSPEGARDTGVTLIAAERARQVASEGWSAGHDAEHAAGELARAAACYAMPPERRLIGTRLADGHGDRGDRYAQYPQGWPWHPDWWKPGDRVRELVKAGALIAAEIDRITSSEEERRGH